MMRRPYDRDWQRVRKRHLAQHPTCVRCGAAGVDVDHVVSVRKAPDRRLDPTNLQTLCPELPQSANPALRWAAQAACRCCLVRCAARSRGHPSYSMPASLSPRAT